MWRHGCHIIRGTLIFTKGLVRGNFFRLLYNLKITRLWHCRFQDISRRWEPGPECVQMDWQGQHREGAAFYSGGLEIPGTPYYCVDRQGTRLGDTHLRRFGRGERRSPLGGGWDTNPNRQFFEVQDLLRIESCSFRVQYLATMHFVCHLSFRKIRKGVVIWRKPRKLRLSCRITPLGRL